MSTKDLTNEAVNKSLSEGIPLTDEQRALLIGLVADDKAWQREADRLRAENLQLRAALAEAEKVAPVALESVHLQRDTSGMCTVKVNGRVAIRDNGDVIDHYATLDWFSCKPAHGITADLLAQECDDGDALLRMLGLDPERYRTEGGLLNLPKIRTALAEAQADAEPHVWHRDHVIDLAAEAGLNGEVWIMGPEELAHLLTLAEMPRRESSDDPWLPFDTAPQDGTRILTMRNDVAVTSYRVQRNDCEMWVFGRTTVAVDVNPKHRPSHWMPHPPLRAAGGEE